MSKDLNKIPPKKGIKESPKKGEKQNISFIKISVIINAILIGCIYTFSLNLYYNNHHFENFVKTTSNPYYLTEPYTKSTPETNSIPMTTDLKYIIKEKQSIYVKESYGESASQCFTDVDLKKFIEKKKVDEIISDLRKDERFNKVISALRSMEATERDKLLSECGKTYKPTWEELGNISKDGQTDSGQKAEKMISTAIVKLARELIKQPRTE